MFRHSLRQDALARSLILLRPLDRHAPSANTKGSASSHDPHLPDVVPRSDKPGVCDPDLSARFALS